MDEEIVNELMEIKTWFQKYLSKMEQDKQQLNMFIEFIDKLVEKEARTDEVPPTTVTLEQVRCVFDDDLLNVLEFSQEGNTIIIQQQQFLERNIWLRINAKVDGINGHWVSAGEDSRWEILVSELP
jgi:hypothetical protein